MNPQKHLHDAKSKCTQQQHPAAAPAPKLQSARGHTSGSGASAQAPKRTQHRMRITLHIIIIIIIITFSRLHRSRRARLHICTSSHLHTFRRTSSHLHTTLFLSPSFSLASLSLSIILCLLSLLLFSLRPGAAPTRRREMHPFRTKCVSSITNREKLCRKRVPSVKIRVSVSPRQPAAGAHTKRVSSAKNCRHVTIFVSRQQPFRAKCVSSVSCASTGPR